jgi:hypothetical protein
MASQTSTQHQTKSLMKKAVWGHRTSQHPEKCKVGRAAEFAVHDRSLRNPDVCYFKPFLNDVEAVLDRFTSLSLTFAIDERGTTCGC